MNLQMVQGLSPISAGACAELLVYYEHVATVGLAQLKTQLPV